MLCVFFGGVGGVLFFLGDFRGGGACFLGIIFALRKRNHRYFFIRHGCVLEKYFFLPLKKSVIRL